MIDHDINEDISMMECAEKALVALDDTKGDMLSAEEAGVDALAVQRFCLAMAALDTAIHNLKLCEIHQRRALVFQRVRGI